MEFRDVVARRRMVRRYRDEPVPAAALERILDTARHAPSAGFSQGQSFVAVTDAATRVRIAELCGEAEYRQRGFCPWLTSAPVHVIPCVREAAYRERYAEPDKAAPERPTNWHVPFWWMDGGAALMLLLLAVVDEGLAAGFLDLADPDGVRRLLRIPSEVAPLGLVTIGYAAEGTRRTSSLSRGQVPRQEVVHYDRW